MKKVIIFLFINSFLLPFNPCAAQRKMTLKECVDITLKNNLTYRESQINTELANADFQQAKALRLPQIGIYAGQSTNVGRSIDRSTNTYIDQVYNANSLGLQFNVPIFYGLQLQHNIRRNELLTQANQKNAEATKNRVIILLLQAYLQTLETQELVAVATQQVTTSKIQADRITKQVDAGTVGMSTLYDLKTQLANDQFSLTLAKNSNIAARLSLFQIMNVSPDRAIAFEPLKEEDIQYQLNSQQEANQFVGDVYGNALNGFPEIKSAELRMQSYDSYIKYVKANTLPSLALNGNYGSFYASSNKQLVYFDQFNANRSGSLSLSLNIPILGKFQNRYRVVSASVQKIYAENQLNIAKLQLRQYIEQIYQGLVAASERYQAAIDQVKATEPNVAAQESRLTAGIGIATSAEYTLAKTNYARALSNLVQAKYEYNLQKKILDFYQTGEFKID